MSLEGYDSRSSRMIAEQQVRFIWQGCIRALGLLLLILNQAGAQDFHYEPEWVRQLPRAPEEIVRAAEKVVRENFGEERFENFFKLRSARTYPEGHLSPAADHLVKFSYRIEGPDYTVEVPISLRLTREGRIDRAEGMLDCRNQPDSCPPFEISRADVIEIARRAGLKPGKKPTTCSGEFFQGYCVALYFHHKYGRYVWGVRTNRLGWRRFLDPRFWFFDEMGKSAIIDAASGKLYEVNYWGAIIDRL